jgi:hypothetical protein
LTSILLGTIAGLTRFISVATPVALQSGNWRTVLVRTKGKIAAVSQPEIGPAAEKRRGFFGFKKRSSGAAFSFL